MEKAAFFAIIDRYAQAAPEQRAALEADLWQRYGVDRAMLALDMAGFSLAVRRDGVVPYLCRIRRMHAITGPLVQSHRGAVIKYEADNLLAAFADADDALQAALAMRTALLAEQPPIVVSLGLSYGRVLEVPGWDAHGDAVNVAFKLGEDLAEAGETLASAEFVAALGDRRHTAGLEAQTLHVAGLSISAYRVVPS